MAERIEVMGIEIEIYHMIDKYLKELDRIKKESNFSLIVDEVIDDIRAQQRYFAPVGTTGKGPHGRIPKSIERSNVVRSESPEGDEWYASTSTDYGPAIFTNEGTKKNYRMWHGGTHPGLERQGWFELGAFAGEELAKKSFQAKVERMLRI